MAVGMRRVRRQNAFNGRSGRDEPKGRVALLCLVVYSVAIRARPPVLSIKASAMVRARAVSSLHCTTVRVEVEFHAARPISQSDCSVLYQGDTCMEIGLSRRVPISPLSKSTCNATQRTSISSVHFVATSRSSLARTRRGREAARWRQPCRQPPRSPPPQRLVRPNARARTERDGRHRTPASVRAAFTSPRPRASRNRRARTTSRRGLPTCRIGLGAVFRRAGRR